MHWFLASNTTQTCVRRLHCDMCACFLQAFARLSAVYGGTYMLHKADATVVYDEAGRAVGVSSEGETAKCKFVVGDPSYFPGKSRPTSRVVRATCILSHPIPNTDNAHSVQIILPQKQIGRRSGARLLLLPLLLCRAVAGGVAGRRVQLGGS